MAAGAGECVVNVVSALSGQSLYSFRFPSSLSVLQVKQRLQADHRLNVFCQRLLLGQAGQPLDDHEVLANLVRPPCGAADAAEGPLTLTLVRLAYVDDDPDARRQLLFAAHDGAADDLER
eukprot:15367017-Heterocapsa_arctica.AAC.1